MQESEGWWKSQKSGAKPTTILTFIIFILVYWELQRNPAFFPLKAPIWRLAASLSSATSCSSIIKSTLSVYCISPSQQTPSVTHIHDTKLNGFIMLSPHDWSDRISLTSAYWVRGCQGTAFIFDFGGFHLGFHLKKIPLKDFEDPWKQTKSDPISKIPHLGLHSFQLFFFWLDQPFIHRLLCRQTLIACMSDHKSNQWHISCLSWFSSAMTYLSWKVCALSWRA